MSRRRRTPSSDDDTELGVEFEPLLDDARDSSEFGPRRQRLGNARHRPLALAVVTETSGLHDRAAVDQRSIDHRIIACEHVVAADGKAVVDEEALLGDSILRDAHRRGRGRHDHGRCQCVECCGRRILEFRRHRVALEGEAPQRIGIVVRGDEVFVRQQSGRSRGVGVEHDRAISHRRSRHHRVASELSATEDPQGGRWDDRRNGHASLCGGSSDDAATSRRSAR
jgi:hypothetical protein